MAQLDGAMAHLKALHDAANGEPDPEWDAAFDAWFDERYPPSMFSSTNGHAWMKHAAYSAILWTSGMLPEDDKVFDV